MNREADVLIIGAGFAGLIAARWLMNRGVEPIVLEARGRVGGRTLTRPSTSGAPIDLGGQWIGPTQTRMYALCEELGFETYPNHLSGHNLLCLGARRHRYRGNIPLIPAPLSLLNMGWMLWRLNAMARQIPLDAPWLAPRAEAWDACTLETWMRRNAPSRAARALLSIGMRTVLACDPGEVSLLHTLFYIRSAGSLELLIDTEGGAQQDRIRGGVQPIAQRLADDLGDRVHLEQPARRIAQDDEGVTVFTDEHRYSARRVIVAIPPTLAGRIDWDPAMPASRDALTQRVFQGSVMKCVAIYDAPFWRSQGFSGQALIDEGPIQAVFDASTPEAQPAQLLGFVEGRHAQHFAGLPRAARRQTALETFARCFGPRALEASEYIDHAWSDEPWSRGCYTGVFPPGLWTAHGSALREPVGRVHWAGTETARVWNGYLEGAIRSGERAAEEILRAR